MERFLARRLLGVDRHRRRDRRSGHCPGQLDLRHDSGSWHERRADPISGAIHSERRAQPRGARAGDRQFGRIQVQLRRSAAHRRGLFSGAGPGFPQRAGPAGRRLRTGDLRFGGGAGADHHRADPRQSRRHGGAIRHRLRGRRRGAARHLREFVRRRPRAAGRRAAQLFAHHLGRDVERRLGRNGRRLGRHRLRQQPKGGDGVGFVRHRDRRGRRHAESDGRRRDGDAGHQRRRHRERRQSQHGR